MNKPSTYTAGNKQTFQSSSTNAGVNVGGVSSNPSSLSADDLWSNTIDSLMFRGSSTYTILSNHTPAKLYNPSGVTFSVTSASVLMMGLSSSTTTNPLTFTPTSTG